jgi:hypothetical protein
LFTTERRRQRTTAAQTLTCKHKYVYKYLTLPHQHVEFQQRISAQTLFGEKLGTEDMDFSDHQETKPQR